MSLSNASLRRKLGEKFQLRRSVSKGTDSDVTQLDPDSSFASSNGSTANQDEKSGSRAKMGALNILGTKVRSLSSGSKKATGVKSTSPPALPKASRSRSSLFDDVKKNNRSSRLFDALGFKSNADLADSLTSSTPNPNDDSLVQPSSTPRPRLSISGLSGHFNRSSSYFSMEAASPSKGADSNTSPGDFNLRSFRNVRGQDVTSPYPAQPGSKHPVASPIPMSSASQYTSRSRTESRQESFVSAEDYLPLSGATSPNYEELSPSNEHSQLDLSAIESKPSSPRIDSARFQGGSISAGRFRKVTASSSRHLEDVESSSPTGKTSSLSESTQRPMRPNSPFFSLTTSPSETLAALEAEMAKGRTTPLMFMNQGEEAQSKASRSNVETRPIDRSTSELYLNSHSSETDYELQDGASPVRRERPTQGNEISPPKLPWIRNETESARRRRASTTNVAQKRSSRGELMGSPFDNQHSGRVWGETSPVNGSTSMLPKSRALSSSPVQDDETFSPQENSARTLSTTGQSTTNGSSLHREGELIPLDYANISASLLNGTSRAHKRSISVTPFVSPALTDPSKAKELLSFHNQQAPLLSAAQSRTEIQPLQAARIAWPSPPCVRMEYFSQLTALHQHSLYEQHCKAADHALAEYLRLMVGVVPPEAMIQPGPLFNTDSGTLSSSNGKSSKGTDLNHRPPRSRSISVPGVHGGSGAQSRRRSLTPAFSRPEVPVPPLPTESVLQRLEGRIQSSRNSLTLDQGVPTSSNGHSSNLERETGSSSLSRRPSARFMVPKHASQAPIDALDGLLGHFNAESNTSVNI